MINLFTEEELLLANKYMNGCPTSVQGNKNSMSQWNIVLYLFDWQQLKSLITPHVEEDISTKHFLNITGWNVSQ